ncbi:A-kinase anchor protein 10, mitochondrial isoform X1 [Takifugu rubripes]|uniref:A-kinase anchoring protein 10 n=2 Tax=Takifugu TaxID=31032 RepID=A0A674PEE8_TAKRU|nr:A-kinase anchor protein 10, mitochondrial isoform X1 [Takifugu rubripes]XP_056909815.1 A-kinase anchor protein 10, mitochondrial isoform X1 [Takifugu flavidus]|eukprot:XP_011615510.1 PREDICTED: A-kinase anchor protein 10, mitochondrial isoform X1 [Takifugu rubripes]
MSFFKRKAKSKEPERVTDVKANRVAPASPRTPSLGAKYQHGGQEVAGPSHVAISAISANMDSFARGRTATLKKQPSHIEATHFGDLGHSSVNYQPQEARSRLSKTVDHILRDNMAIPHFMHFTELRSIDHLVRFWLEAESFRSTSWSRIRAHSLNSVKHSTLAEPIFTSQDGSEVQEVIQPDGDAVEGGSCNMLVAQSKLRDSSTTETSPGPCTPQTDTPTSQPSSRTGTPYKTSSTTRDISGKLMKSIEKDAVTIFTRFISPDAVRPIPITEQIRNDIVAKICGEDGMVDPNCFVIAQTVVKAILEEQHFSEFLRSHHYCKYQIEVLTSGSVFLADILFCESALFYFSEYIEKEEAMNILQFWLAADNFQNQLAAKKGQYDGLEAQNDAMILYDKYFSLQATNPLGFGDSVRMEIESNICREGGPLPDCFITPLRQAWTTMEKVYLPGFLSSNLYYKYLSDLINSVRADEFMLVSAQGQTGQADNDRSSSTSSDGPHAQQGTKKAAVKILKNFDEAITVDIASLDPEQLYQRPYAGKMTFGKVNELGQFIRESEPEPDAKKSKGSVFSQAMKKWVQGSSDQAQEEMAWQIAKMIVNDVVSQSNHCSPVRSTKL